MILSVNGLKFTYRSREVLKGINLQARCHEIITILGPNGAGKTTLLKCVNAMLRPQEGTVFISGEDTVAMDKIEIAKKIGYVSQRGEASRITVFDAVLLGRYPYLGWKVSEQDLKITNAIIDRLHLGPFSLRYINELSGGELQKVRIARALVQDPALLLLDEPTSNLDLKNQMEILGLIKAIANSHNVAVLMTLHDINTALRYSDRLLFIKDGLIAADLKPPQVTEDIIRKVYDVPVRIQWYEDHPVVIPLEKETNKYGTSF